MCFFVFYGSLWFIFLSISDDLNLFRYFSIYLYNFLPSFYIWFYFCISLSIHLPISFSLFLYISFYIFFSNLAILFLSSFLFQSLPESTCASSSSAEVGVIKKLPGEEEKVLQFIDNEIGPQCVYPINMTLFETWHCRVNQSWICVFYWTEQVSCFLSRRKDKAKLSKCFLHDNLSQKEGCAIPSSSTNDMTCQNHANLRLLLSKFSQRWKWKTDPRETGAA